MLKCVGVCGFSGDEFSQRRSFNTNGVGGKKSRMARKSLFCLCALTAAMVLGCEDTKHEAPVGAGGDIGPVLTNKPHDEVTRGFAMNARNGCALDSDCAAGLFCFHGACTSQCSATKPCDVGTCSERGRCVKSNSAQSLARDLKTDLSEAQKSSVVDSIPGARIHAKPSEKTYVEKGANKVEMTIVTEESYGAISYTVTDVVDGTISDVETVEPEIDEVTGQATYIITVNTVQSSLGEQGSVETVVVDTSLGSYEVALVPQKPATALYEGSVMADNFAGVGLPIRFGLEVVPENINKYEDIKGLTLYLPSSGSDLFSPEIVSDASKTVWSKVKMQKSDECIDESNDSCWVAEYSTNDYTFAGSRLVDASQKVNRSIRIEIYGYDADSGMMFDGAMRDIIAGVYRNADLSGKKQWAKAAMNGVFIANRSSAFDTSAEGFESVDHVKNAEQLRPLDGAAADVCNDSSIAALMAFAKCDEDDDACDLSDCASIATLDAYKSSEAAQKCLLAAADKLVASDDMVSKIIEKLITREATDLNPVHGFATLQEFMNDCALDGGICKERPEITCAVDLLGRSYLTSDDSNKVEMLKNWHQLLRESYLGRQYSAWQNDTEVRRKWLENSTSPSFLASTLEKINSDMLGLWERNVFNAHQHVMARQFNQTSLEVLTRVESDPVIVAERDVILSEFADGWAGVSDSLSLGLRRYNTLYQNTIDRKTKAAQMRPHLFDLYYAGLVETALNKDYGNGSLNASYGKDLFTNVSTLRQLDRSFSSLVFMRDAEVVTSTSVDPLTGNALVLSDRKKLAKETVAAAQARRDKVFDDYDHKTINREQINATLTNAIDSLQTELVSICGLPRGCRTVEDKDCAPRAIPGFCGFDIPADSDRPGDVDKALDVSTVDVNSQIAYYANKKYKIDKNTALEKNNLYDFYSMTNTGEAAEAILAYRSAVKDVDIAKSEYIALYNKVTIAESTCESYAANIESWNVSRNELLRTIQKNIEVINAHYDNITQAERDKIAGELKLLEDAYKQQSDYIKNWKDVVAKNYMGEQNKYITEINSLTKYVSDLEYSASVMDGLKDVAQSLWEEPTTPDSLFGFSKFGAAKAVVTAAFNVIIFGLEGAANTANKKIADNEKDMELSTLNYEYTTELDSLNNDLKLQELELNLQRSLAKYDSYGDKDSCMAASETDCHSEVVCNCSDADDDLSDIYSEVSCPTEKGCKLETSWYVMGLDQWILSEQNAIDSLDEVNDTLRELFEVQDAYNRDLQDLDFKRSEYLSLSQDLIVKREQILKAEIAQYTALKHYYAVLQRAVTLQSQYDAAKERLQKINNLYSTPAAIFAFASDLEIVESKIELAKERIYDYLAAVEYLSVRPFVDLRRATYLARSTNDLDAIIDQIDTVVTKCGGGTNNVATVEVSAREMMGITQDTAEMTAGERFRSVIAKGNIPINSLTRYTVDSNVRDLVKKGLDLRSGTFAVTIDKQMNLATTCNAKIESIAIQIVGNDVIKPGAGENVVPTITLFYDGQAQLVSCQPNIDTLVSTINPSNPDESTLDITTSYGKYSTFVVTPTKISPTAKINEYGEANITLAGKPFATSYTVLIDTTISENSKIDWDKVDDIKFKINYSYQDLFPNTSACVSL